MKIEQTMAYTLFVSQQELLVLKSALSFYDTDEGDRIVEQMNEILHTDDDDDDDEVEQEQKPDPKQHSKKRK